MNYFELNYKLNYINEFADIIVADLAELGFESFSDEDLCSKAYIKFDLFNHKIVTDYCESLMPKHISSFDIIEIPMVNWNEEWEKNYSSVIVDNCMVRAPFHPIDANVKYDIIIEPKMSFGTAHHETTSQMIELILKTDFINKRVLDMGCGTGVLAILASMRGAADVLAIDIDEWPVLNSIENVSVNQIKNINVIQGDSSSIKGMKFDIILANINRNILLADVNSYSACLSSENILLISGIYTADLELINRVFSENALIYERHVEKNQWVAAVYHKK